MASENRSASGLVAFEQALQEAPWKFGFYQTLRRFESLRTDKPRIGESLRQADDVLRFSQEPSLIFAPSTLAAFETGEEGELSRLVVHFFGMFGPDGPLPLHLTEYARDRERNADDPTFSAFVDIFHNRMLSLFYRSWANSQPTVSFDRPDEDRFGVYTGAMIGLGMPSLRNRDEIPDFTKLHFAGRLSAQTRNGEGLVAMIESFFKLPAEIEQFVGEWMKLPDNCECRLGVSQEGTTLGVNISVGEFVWQCQQKFSIILGPLSINEYRGMLPGGESANRLCALVRNYVGDSMNWDVRLVLKKQSVPGITLGKASFIGWNSWLGERAQDQDADDLVIDSLQ